jgi:hypothetical protein
LVGGDPILALEYRDRRSWMTQLKLARRREADDAGADHG